MTGRPLSGAVERSVRAQRVWEAEHLAAGRPPRALKAGSLFAEAIATAPSAPEAD